MRALTEVTRPSLLLLYAAIVAGVAALRGRARWLYLPAAVLVANVLSHLLKAVIGRQRPGPEFQLVHEVNPAMPSGHAMGAAAFAAALTLLVGGRRVWLCVAAWALAVLAGMSRLYLGVHWFSDVVVGFLLGVAVSVVMWRLPSPTATASDSGDRPGR